MVTFCSLSSLILSCSDASSPSLSVGQLSGSLCAALPAVACCRDSSVALFFCVKVSRTLSRSSSSDVCPLMRAIWSCQWNDHFQCYNDFPNPGSRDLLKPSKRSHWQMGTDMFTQFIYAIYLTRLCATYSIVILFTLTRLCYFNRYVQIWVHFSLWVLIGQDNWTGSKDDNDSQCFDSSSSPVLFSLREFEPSDS